MMTYLKAVFTTLSVLMALLVIFMGWALRDFAVYGPLSQEHYAALGAGPGAAPVSRGREWEGALDVLQDVERRDLWLRRIDRVGRLDRIERTVRELVH